MATKHIPKASWNTANPKNKREFRPDWKINDSLKESISERDAEIARLTQCLRDVIRCWNDCDKAMRHYTYLTIAATDYMAQEVRDMRATVKRAEAGL